MVVRGGDCDASVLVGVDVAGALPGVRYLAFGNVLESDEPDDEPDVCCALSPRSFLAGDEGTHSLVLEGQTSEVDLGLVKGFGPASDETFSPDFVELFAQIFVRNLTTGALSGPWRSPIRDAVALGGLDWTLSSRLPGGGLAVGPGSGRNTPAPRLPPIRCAR